MIPPADGGSLATGLVLEPSSDRGTAAAGLVVAPPADAGRAAAGRVGAASAEAKLAAEIISKTTYKIPVRDSYYYYLYGLAVRKSSKSSTRGASAINCGKLRRCRPTVLDTAKQVDDSL